MSQGEQPQLVRGIGLASATALNMIDMIGVGPFVTMPLIITAMHGPQAMLGWIFGAVFAVCDGLVWAELGAAFPGSGGSYRYLKEIYGPDKLGRLMAFLFIWQLSFSAPLSIASGCIGLANYATYFFPKLATIYAVRHAAVDIPLLGPLRADLVLSAGTLVAIGTCAVVVFLLYRRITAIGKLSRVLWVGVVGTVLWVIFAGVTHFSAARAFSFPPGAFTFDKDFFLGLGSAMLIATYDYWGYYNVCFLGDEIKDPSRNIPRALLLSIAIVGAFYILMNTGLLGVIPWQEIGGVSGANSRYIFSVFMQRIYGNWAGYLITALIMLTAFSSVFSLLLGYSRVPYAAALDGNYFRIFARVHPEHRFPYVSLLMLGAVAAAACFLQLADVIAALVIIRIAVQFLFQSVGLIVLRIRRPDAPRPFRMWLYPLPALLASLGFVYVLIARPNSMKEVRYAVVIAVVGVIVYLVRSWKRKEWPFAVPTATQVATR